MMLVPSMWQSTVSVRKHMWMQLVTSVILAHSQSDSVSCEVCQRLEWSIVHSLDLVSLQMFVGSFVLDCWRGFVQDNMSPNRKEFMRWWMCMRCHVRKNGLVSYVMQEWFGIVWRSSSAHVFLMFTIAHREVLNSVRCEKHVGVLHTQDYLDYFAHARREEGQKSGKQIGRDETQSKVLNLISGF